jgi:arsenite methyltransferase
MEAWTGCVAGALTRTQYESHLTGVGFEQVELVETHRVHDQAGSAFVRARKP